MHAVNEPDEIKKKVEECHGAVEVTYPIEVKYCGNCSMPIEYCEYYAEYDKCKEWLAKNYPEDYEKLMLREVEEAAGASAGGMDSDRKRQKRGGKGMLRAKKDNEDDNELKCVRLSCTTRGKNKRVTLVAGLAAFKIDLRAAAKFFGTKFACGSSVSGDKEIVIQGDVKDDLLEVIPDKWPEVPRDAIDDCGESKKRGQS